MFAGKVPYFQETDREKPDFSVVCYICNKLFNAVLSTGAALNAFLRIMQGISKSYLLRSVILLGNQISAFRQLMVY